MTRRIEQPDAAAETPRAPDIQETALGDRMVAALNDLRGQLRLGQAVALPAFLRQCLPAEPKEGDRAKVDAWRAYVVWTEWSGDEWVTEVYQDGKLRE